MTVPSPGYGQLNVYLSIPESLRGELEEMFIDLTCYNYQLI
jgi:hypothetical protein